MKRRFVISALLVIGLLGSAPLWAHDVKDPVCRMDVDTHTATYKSVYRGKTYYFCSAGDQAKFLKTPSHYVTVLETLDKKPQTYRVELKTQRPPESGKPVQMELIVRSGTSIVKQFELIHDKRMHLVIVSEDLSTFQHEHPIQNAQGTFDLSWTFPAGGNYWLYADFTPSDGDNQLLQVPLVVSGTPASTQPLVVDPSFQKTIEGYRVTLALNPDPLRMEQASLLTYTINDATGKPVTDLEPYLGTMGHLFAIRQDGKDVVHTHTVHESGRVDAGPAQSFKLIPPSEGIYKIWAQFSHKGKVLTIPFVVNVKPLWDKKAEISCPGQACREGTHAEN